MALAIFGLSSIFVIDETLGQALQPTALLFDESGGRNRDARSRRAIFVSRKHTRRSVASGHTNVVAGNPSKLVK
jgi:hypothetical protein